MNLEMKDIGVCTSMYSLLELFMNGKMFTGVTWRAVISPLQLIAEPITKQQ